MHGKHRWVVYIYIQTEGRKRSHSGEVIMLQCLDESGLDDGHGFETEKDSPKMVRFNSSDDFQKVMMEMFPPENPTRPPTRSRATERWIRIRRQPSTNTDVTDVVDSVFLRSELDVTSTPRTSVEERRSKPSRSLTKRSSTRSLLSDAGSPTRSRLPSVSWAEAEEKREKLAKASEKGWHAIRRYVEDKTFEHQTSNVITSWAMIRQHLFNMSDLDKTRKDIYERYGVLPRLNTDGTYTMSNVMLSPRSKTAITKNNPTF